MASSAHHGVVNVLWKTSAIKSLACPTGDFRPCQSTKDIWNEQSLDVGDCNNDVDAQGSRWLVSTSETTRLYTRAKFTVIGTGATLNARQVVLCGVLLNLSIFGSSKFKLGHHCQKKLLKNNVKERMLESPVNREVHWNSTIKWWGGGTNMVIQPKKGEKTVLCLSERGYLTFVLMFMAKSTKSENIVCTFKNIRPRKVF